MMLTLPFDAHMYVKQTHTCSQTSNMMLQPGRTFFVPSKLYPKHYVRARLPW